MKYQELQYEQDSQHFPNVVPMKSVVPQWYKSLDRFVGGKANYESGSLNVGLKLCMPFLDSLTIGYSIPLIIDLFVTQTAEGPIINWNDGQVKPIDLRTSANSTTYPKPAGFSEKQFVWKFQTALQVPKGYSFLFTHPLNRFDLPFFTYSGVVDGGWVMGTGDVPVVIKNDFEGIIPAGTPIAQIIPFKQESWKAIKKENLRNESLLNTQRSLSKIYGWYKSTHWTKKEYL
jgi:hypothetical protein